MSEAGEAMLSKSFLGRATHLLSSYRLLFRVAFHSMFFLFEWKDSGKEFVLTKSVVKLRGFYAKSLLFSIYFLYQISHIPIHILGGHGSKMTLRVMFSFSWSLFATISSWFHWNFWIHRESCLGPLNSFLAFTDSGGEFKSKTVLEVSSWSLIGVHSYILYAPLNCILASLGVSFLFFFDPKHSRFLYSLLPPEHATRMTFILAYALELYIIMHFITLLNMIYVHLLINSTFNYTWLSELRAVKGGNLFLGKNASSKIRQIFATYNKLKVLNTWYNSSYETMFNAACSAFTIGTHAFATYVTIRAGHNLPAPAFAAVAFWAVAYFPLEISVYNVMGSVASTSYSLIYNWTIDLSPEEQRVLRSFRPLGIKSGKLIKQSKALRIIVTVSKSIRYLLLTVSNQ